MVFKSFNSPGPLKRSIAVSVRVTTYIGGWKLLHPSYALLDGSLLKLLFKFQLSSASRANFECILRPHVSIRPSFNCYNIHSREFRWEK